MDRSCQVFQSGTPVCDCHRYQRLSAQIGQSRHHSFGTFSGVKNALVHDSLIELKRLQMIRR